MVNEHYLNNNKPRFNLHPICVFLLFVAALAGQFSLARIDPQYESAGYLVQPRIWLIASLVLLSIPFVFPPRKEIADRNKEVSAWLLLVILFHFYMAITYSWSLQGEHARNAVVSLLLVVVLVVVGYALVRFDARAAITIFLYLFFIASLLYATVGLGQLLAGGSGRRLSVFLGGPNVYVRVVGTGVILALYLWAKTRSRVWLLSIPLLLFTGIMSGSRGGMLSLTLALFLALLLVTRKIRRLLLVVSLLIVFVLVLLYLPLASTYKEYIEYRYPLDLVELSLQYEHARGPWFSGSYQAFLDSPLLGRGLARQNDSGFGYAHNIFINIAAEGGLLGLLLFALTLIPIYARWKRDRGPLADVCLVLAVFYLLASLASGTYYDWRFIWLFFLLYMMPSSPSAGPEKCHEHVPEQAV